MSSGRHWKKPATKVYDCNYRQGESMYKDQIDRLDNKTRPRVSFGTSSFGDSGLGSSRRLSDDFPSFRRREDEGSSLGGAAERPRFNFGERLQDSGSQGPLTAALSAAGLSDDPFFASARKPRSAEADMFTEDPFKSRREAGSRAMERARNQADEMMEDMRRDADASSSRMRSRMAMNRSEMSSGTSNATDSFGGGSKLDAIGQRARARLADLANYEDDMGSSSLLGSRGSQEGNSGASRSIRISKRTVKSTLESS